MRARLLGSGAHRTPSRLHHPKKIAEDPIPCDHTVSSTQYLKSIAYPEREKLVEAVSFSEATEQMPRFFQWLQSITNGVIAPALGSNHVQIKFQDGMRSASSQSGLGDFPTMISLLDWIPRKSLVLALGLSVGISIGSLILAPLIIARLPADYFQERPHRPEASALTRNLPHYLIASLKNVLGFTLIVIGAAMVPFPGQGLLTMVVGIGLVNFPGKQQLVNAIVSRPSVLRSLNWFRRKARKAPFLKPVVA